MRNYRYMMLAGIVACVMAMVAAPAMAGFAYETGFEAPTYTSGAGINGVDGWTTTSGLNTVETATNPVTGAQVLKHASGGTNPVYRTVTVPTAFTYTVFLMTPEVITTHVHMCRSDGSVAFWGAVDMGDSGRFWTTKASGSEASATGTYVANTWYKLVFDVRDGTGGANDNTYDFSVYSDIGSGFTNLVWSKANLGLRDTAAGRIETFKFRNSAGGTISYWDDVSMTPEPATMGLLGLGGVGLLIRRKR